MWLFMRRERPAVQKKRCLLLSGAAPMSPAVALLASRPLSFVSHLYRRDLDQNQHGTAARMGPKGEWIRGFAPHGRWRTLTFLGALRCDRLTAPCLAGGPINGECFRAYVEQILLPSLHPGDINIQLGRNGRNRTNKYDSAGTQSRKGNNVLELHPTVKPIQLVMGRSATKWLRLKGEPRTCKQSLLRSSRRTSSLRLSRLCSVTTRGFRGKGHAKKRCHFFRQHRPSRRHQL
jgi:hypothetical protein